MKAKEGKILGLCIAISEPNDVIAYSIDSFPIFSAANLLPSAKISPIPSLLMIFLTNSTIALELPHVSSKPSVSSVVKIPFSKHSIAKATVAPVDIVSIAALLHSSFISNIDNRSSLSRRAPKEQHVSYSGRCVSSKFNSGTFKIAPHWTGQL